MSRAVQSKKRVKFLETIIKKMSKNVIFEGTVSRTSYSESEIQKALFLKLKEELPKVLQSQYNFSKEYAQKIIEEEFLWEKSVHTTVHNFSFFATNHRPDSVLSINEDFRIAIELKKGDQGSALRSGLGQALLYSTQFDFVIFFFIDFTKGLDIKSACSGKKEKELLETLWDQYNIKFIVV